MQTGAGQFDRCRRFSSSFSRSAFSPCLAYGAMFALVIFVEPNKGEMSERIPSEESIRKNSLHPMNSAAQIEAFLEMMSAERGAADNTLASYRRDLDDASSSIAGGLAGCGQQTTSAAYLGRHRRTGLRRFLAGAQTVGAASVLQVSLCRGPARRRSDRHAGQSKRAARPLPKTMSEAETGRLLDRAAAEAADESLADAAGIAAKRLHALVEVLYATGLRVSELVGLPVTVALRDERFFIVRGKGNKERMVPLSAKGAGGDARLAGRTQPRCPHWPPAPTCFRPHQTAATCPARSSPAT